MAMRAHPSRKLRRTCADCLVTGKMQDCVTDWQSPVIPPTIRRPWRVFEEDLEEKVTSNASQVGQVDAKVREQIAAVQAKGARVAFLSLSESERQTYYQVALHELSAFVFWRRSQLARQKSGEILPTDMEAGWDLLDLNDKGEWLPQDPIAFLRADAQWATLLADVHGGDEQIGTEDLQAVPTPMKSEILATAKAPVKKEPNVSIAAAPTPQPPVKKEPSAPACKPAAAPNAGPTKPPAATAQMEAVVAVPTAKASAKALKQEPAPPAKTAAEFPKKAAAVEKGPEQTETGTKQPSSAIVPAPPAHEKKRKEAKPAPEATRRSRRVNPDGETNGAAEKKAAAAEASGTGRATARKRAPEPHERAEATSKQQGSRRLRAEDAAPANLFPEALEAKCCVCNESHASMENDLAMCDVLSV
ncbi:hypothetical protein AK812_SmicGene14893 [Symbiodinium microadriaticum]|uniref:Uncharacterized protein n=1 Tax=Symbiodinium microadriaticum TaxID=2951 RepID=A0A1Q9E4D2_SYMMI|nr:hypothetical protein AK812_SmicGene14893 [Symbiodinium microadriaticum]